MTWPTLAIFSAVCFAVNLLILKWAANAGLPPQVSLFFLYSGGAVCFLSHAWMKGSSLVVDTKILLVLCLTGIISYVGNLLQVKSLTLAPNPGYTAAIVASQAIIVATGSIFLFHSTLTTFKTLGIAFCVIGVALISIEFAGAPK